PWRWLPTWNPAFTAAYFDETGLYAFGRQPEAIHWNCAQLAVSLLGIADEGALRAALDRFGPLYSEAMIRRFCWTLGVAVSAPERDVTLIEAADRERRESGTGPDQFFVVHRGGRNANAPLADALKGREPSDSSHSYWADPEPQSMLIDEVEEIWSHIAEHDDWAPLERKIVRLRRMGEAHGPAPIPSGHIADPQPNFA